MTSKIVPREPTQEMEDAASPGMFRREVWRAMYDAAPAMEKPADESALLEAEKANAFCAIILEQERVRFQNETRHSSRLTQALIALVDRIHATGGEIGRNDSAVITAEASIKTPVNFVDQPPADHAATEDADDRLLSEIDRYAQSPHDGITLMTKAADRIAELLHELRGSKSDHMATSRMHQHELARAEAAEVERDRLLRERLPYHNEIAFITAERDRLREELAEIVCGPSTDAVGGTNNDA